MAAYVVLAGRDHQNGNGVDILVKCCIAGLIVGSLMIAGNQ